MRTQRETDLEAKIERLQARVEALEGALIEIRDVAYCSEGVEFYGMLAEEALSATEQGEKDGH